MDLDEGIIQWEAGTTNNKRGRVLAFNGIPAPAALIHRWREEPPPEVLQRYRDSG